MHQSSSSVDEHDLQNKNGVVTPKNNEATTPNVAGSKNTPNECLEVGSKKYVFAHDLTINLNKNTNDALIVIFG